MDEKNTAGAPQEAQSGAQGAQQTPARAKGEQRPRRERRPEREHRNRNNRNRDTQSREGGQERREGREGEHARGGRPPRPRRRRDGERDHGRASERTPRPERPGSGRAVRPAQEVPAGEQEETQVSLQAAVLEESVSGEEMSAGIAMVSVQVGSEETTVVPAVPQEEEQAAEAAVQAPAEEAPRKKESAPRRTVRVAGVRFRPAGKIYYFDPLDFPLHRGVHVIVETARGTEYGMVVGELMDVDARRVTMPLRSILRIADPADDARVELHREQEKRALKICKEKVRKHELEMKVIQAEYAFDNSRIVFYFTADGRVDFRELVKDLAGVFRTRIELRQVGVRDETKILGGYGICGRPLCCHTWQTDFGSVSIRMAKEQNLSLNPGKISGVCGRLMCCLRNEEETYEELNKKLPHNGDEVQAADGKTGVVESTNILRQTVRILIEEDDEKELHEYPASELTILRRRKRGQSKVRRESVSQARGERRKNHERKN